MPGTEVAGVVLSAPDDSGFVPGQRVRVLAVSSLGGYASGVAVHRNLVLPIPDELTFEEAASLIINYQTMEFALGRRARLQPGETVAVLGAAGGGGDVGDPVGEGPRGPGDRGRAPGRCRRLPARDRRRRRRPMADGWAAQVRELTGGRGADVVIDPVGGDAFDDAVRALAPEGRLVVIGFAGGGIRRSR